MVTHTRDVAPPSPAATYAALLCVADALGTDICWLLRRRYHFTVRGDYTIALSADSAGRFRVDACRLGRPVSTLWVREGEHRRLAGVVRTLNERLDALAASEHGGERHDDGAFDAEGFSTR